MVNANYTDITILLDKSSSMQGAESVTIEGINEFVKSQTKVEGKCRVSLALFDSPGNLNVVHDAVPISELPQLNSDVYVADGWSTAYFDALGQTIKKTGERFANMPESERPGKVLFVVMTDGHENDSREFTRGMLSRILERQENTYDWDFVFLGASFDAVSEYGTLLSKEGRSANYDKGDTVFAFNNLSKNVTSYRGASLQAKNAVDLSAGVGE